MPIDHTPPADEIRWDISPDSLFVIALAHWPAVEAALRALQAEADGNLALPPVEAVRRLRAPAPAVRPAPARPTWRTEFPGTARPDPDR